MENTIEARFAAAFSKATVSRGPRKGMLLAQCPPVDTDEAAVWQGLMGKANPFKVGFGHLMFMRAERRELYDYTRKLSQTMDPEVIRNIDRDRKGLEAAGVWY